MDKTNKLQIPLSSKQFFSVEEAALFIGVSRRTLFKMKKEGKIEYIQIGRRIIFDKDAVINLVKNLGINPSLKWRVPKDVEIEIAPLEDVKPKNKPTPNGRPPSTTSRTIPSVLADSATCQFCKERGCFPSVTR